MRRPIPAYNLASGKLLVVGTREQAWYTSRRNDRDANGLSVSCIEQRTSQETWAWKDRRVSGRVFLMHPLRDDFMATMAERLAFDAHAARLRMLLADGVLIASGPCLAGLTPES